MNSRSPTHYFKGTNMRKLRKEVIDEIRRTRRDAKLLKQALIRTERNVKEFEQELHKVEKKVAKARQNLQAAKINRSNS